MMKIVIEFERELDSEKLEELINQISAQCEEDDEGYSWGGGRFDITVVNEFDRIVLGDCEEEEG